MQLLGSLGGEQGDNPATATAGGAGQAAVGKQAPPGGIDFSALLADSAIGQAQGSLARQQAQQEMWKAFAPQQQGMDLSQFMR